LAKLAYDLEERLLEYSVRIIKIVEQLPNTRVGNHTSIKTAERKKQKVIQGLARDV